MNKRIGMCYVDAPKPLKECKHFVLQTHTKQKGIKRRRSREGGGQGVIKKELRCAMHMYQLLIRKLKIMYYVHALIN